jgi:hypothetical protein
MSNSMDKQGIKKMQDALIQSDPKWIADRKKALEDKEKSDSEIQGRKDVAHITGGYSVQRANIQAAAKAAAQAKTQSILQITKGDPVKTIAALVTEGNRLLKEGKVDEANALFEAANDPVLRTAASNQQANAGKLTLGPDGQLATTGASAPLPQAGPPAAQPGVPPGAPQPAAPAPQAAPQGATKTATGPGGVKIFLVNGQWVNAQGQPVQ